MPSSKKERGRTKRYHRDINNERKAHLEQRALGPVADTELSSGQQRYYDAKFVPIVLREKKRVVKPSPWTTIKQMMAIKVMIRTGPNSC